MAREGPRAEQKRKAVAAPASIEAGELLTSLLRLLEGLPGVRVKKSATHASFLTGKKVFGFSRPSGFVLKLPRERIEELTCQGRAAFLVMGKRTLREWALIQRRNTNDDEGNRALMKESIAFAPASGVAKRS